MDLSGFGPVGGLKDTRAVGDAAEPIVTAQGSPPALQQVSVAVLPMGTSNDFAATTGYPQVTTSTSYIDVRA